MSECPYCGRDCGHPDICGAELDQPECPCPPMMQRVAHCPDCPLRALKPEETP